MQRSHFGPYGIKVTVLADSINAAGNRFLTFETEYWRGILAELNTHRALSKNSFSSRAVPFEKMLKQLTGRPVRFGANQAGMQDKGEDFDAEITYEVAEHGELISNVSSPAFAWEDAKFQAINIATAFKEAGYHKQVYNRLVEPFQMMKTVLSGTELSNFFWLRDDDAADPSLHALAKVMREAAAASTPTLLKAGEWHLPYLNYYNEQIGWEDDGDTPIYGPQVFYIGEMGNSDFQVLTLEEAIKVSCARCAAVSYRNEGYGLEKSIELYERLVGADRKHASALEHCATPMQECNMIAFLNGRETVLVDHPAASYTWEPGITHADRKGRLWSGNLRGWIQHRKLIPGENYEG